MLEQATPVRSLCDPPAGTIAQPVPSHFSMSPPLKPTQFETLAQEIATRVVTRSSAGLATIDHEAPSQCSTSAVVFPFTGKKEPTAKQLVTAGHEMPNRRLNWTGAGKRGSGTIDQRDPFQRSTNALAKPASVSFDSPTVKHAAVLVHETSASVLDVAPGRFALATIDHAVPFQRSTSVLVSDEFTIDEPTAKQLESDAHETCSNVLDRLAFGLGTIDHVCPSQCSTRVLRTSVWEKAEPTAKQLVLVGHAIPNSWLTRGRAGLGLGTTVQAEPFHCSINVLLVGPWAGRYTPTPKQRVTGRARDARELPLGIHGYRRHRSGDDRPVASAQTSDDRVAVDRLGRAAVRADGDTARLARARHAEHRGGHGRRRDSRSARSRSRARASPRARCTPERRHHQRGDQTHDPETQSHAPTRWAVVPHDPPIDRQLLGKLHRPRISENQGLAIFPCRPGRVAPRMR